jgi:hypothetical protein
MASPLRNSALTEAGLGKGADADVTPEPLTAGSGGLPMAMIILAAICLRMMAYALGPMGDIDRAMSADTAAAIELASAAAATGSLAPFDGWTAGEEATATPPPLPGYPLVLAGVLAVGLPLDALVLAQVAMSALLAWLTYALAWSLLRDRTAALVAAGIVVLHPAMIVASLTLSPHVLFLVAVLAALSMIASPLRHDFAGGVLAGLCLGLAVMLKPLTILVAPAVAMWMILRGRNLAAVGAGTVLVVASLTPAGLWMLRNHAAGGPVWPHQTSILTGLDEGVALSEPAAMLMRVREQAAPVFVGHGVPELAARFGITPEPIATPLLLPIIEPARLLTVRDGGTALAILWTLGNLVLAVMALAGCLMLLVRGWLPTVLLAVAGCGLVLVTAATPGDEWARLVALPLQALVASAVMLPGLSEAWAKRRAEARARRAAIAAATEPDLSPVVVRGGRPL